MRKNDLYAGEVFLRAKGEILSEAREGRSILIERLKQMGARDFKAQYQQDPYVPPFMPDVVCGTWTYGSFPDTWVPGDGMPPTFLTGIPQTVFLLKELFDEGEPPKSWDYDVGSFLTPERWEQSAVIQQRRLIAWAQQGGPKPQHAPLSYWGVEKTDEDGYFGGYRPLRKQDVQS